VGESSKTAVVVEAPDQLGLFGAICAWFAGEGHSIDSVHADIDGDGVARDTFVVDGEPESQRMARDLSN
jgi:UTP:GlnB (protein PII) uridylyltransferase